MRVCFVTAECVPYVKTGGLADVSGALPRALASQGCDVKVALPCYGTIDIERHGLEPMTTSRPLAAPVGDAEVPFSLRTGHLPGSSAEVIAVDCPQYFHRATPYTEDADEDERFIFFQRAALVTLQHLAWRPDVVHCHDWHAGLIPALLREDASGSFFDGTGTVYTIHNIGYQGRFSEAAIGKAGLSHDEYYPGGPFEFYGSFCFMKAGMVYADVVSTVSPTYAEEIQTPALGAGLDGVLRARPHGVAGILNGVDTARWNPSTDEHLAAPYDVDTLQGKMQNKGALQHEMGLPAEAQTPVIGIISRFVAQKGLDLLKPVLANILQRHAVQFAVLGSGEQHLEDFFHWARTAFPDRVGLYLGYNEPLAHRIEAGADLFLMPSRYEPCGLNQMYSLMYGTVPIVRKTGGLADTVIDQTAEGSNGFTFTNATPFALYEAVERALTVYRNRDAWACLMRRGMQMDFSWEASARRYMDLYRRVRRG